jgi:hypothetical protein
MKGCLGWVDARHLSKDIFYLLGNKMYYKCYRYNANTICRILTLVTSRRNISKCTRAYGSGSTANEPDDLLYKFSYNTRVMNESRCIPITRCGLSDVSRKPFPLTYNNFWN